MCQGSLRDGRYPGFPESENRFPELRIHAFRGALLRRRNRPYTGTVVAKVRRADGADKSRGCLRGTFLRASLFLMGSRVDGGLVDHRSTTRERDPGPRLIAGPPISSQESAFHLSSARDPLSLRWRDRVGSPVDHRFPHQYAQGQSNFLAGSRKGSHA